MDVQRYAHTWAVDPPLPADNGKWVLYADHARIVAEMEQAHAAALADLGFLESGTEDYMCPNCVTPWKCNGPHLPDPSYAAAPRTLTRDGWWPFGSFVDYDFPLEFDGEGEDGLPIWERPDKSRMQPRTLTADCLHLAEMYVGQSGRDNEYGRRSSVIECLACGALRLDDETVPNGVHHWYAADEVAATDGEATT